MALIGILVLLPLLVALLLLFVKRDETRTVIVGAASVAVTLVSLALAFSFLGAPWIRIGFSSEVVDVCASLAGFAAAVAVLYYGAKHKNVLALVLAAVQLVGSLYFDVFVAHGVEVPDGLYVDSLTIVMALIIGIIGSGI